MSMVCGLDLHRQQITFDAMDTASLNLPGFHAGSVACVSPGSGETF